MAAHAVVKIGDAFFTVLGLHARGIVLVAAIAGVGPVVRRRVARRAGNGAAFAVIQWERRVIEHCALPCGSRVALRAVRAKRAQMLLWFGMASHTGLRRALEDVVLMALLALHIHMRARQLECGQVVIELRILPTRWIMALPAVRAERARVAIVVRMTTYTGLRCTLEDTVDVTLCAFDFHMRARQLERGQIVIELRIIPAIRGVALRAVCAKLAIVRVVFQMAVGARRRRLFEIGHGAHIRMTPAAGDIGVLAAQRELQHIVIELRETIDAVVTRQTLMTEVGRVLRHEIALIFTMALFAQRAIERGHLVAVTIGARKQLAVG